MPHRKITFDTVKELALKLPNVIEGTSYGTPALHVKKKFLCRLREDGESVAFKVGFDERDLLMQVKPDVFFITDHYLAWPAVLLRLSAAKRGDVAQIVEMSYRFVTAKKPRL